MIETQIVIPPTKKWSVERLMTMEEDDIKKKKKKNRVNREVRGSEERERGRRKAKKRSRLTSTQKKQEI